MTQAFLNEPTIEEAREVYLKRWHLETVQSAWNGRKPTIAQFKKRFGKAYTTRQKFLARGEGTVAVATEQHEDAVQVIAERVLSLMGGVASPEPEAEILGSADDIDLDDEKPATVIERLKAKTAPKVNKTKPVQKDDEPKFVKPENFDELPRSGQVYFFLHRAREAGYDYAIVPIKRGVIAECISQIKDDGRSYQSVASDLIKRK